MSKQSLSDLYRSNPVRACQIALRRTSRMDSKGRLEAINKLLGGFGTEAIRGEWQNGYWCDIVACYVNMGDTYSTTVIQERTEYGCSRFYVSTMGDFVERKGDKLGVV